MGGVIKNCVNNGSILGPHRIGGIASDNEGYILNCINTGAIATTASGPDFFNGVGGIAATA